MFQSDVQALVLAPESTYEGHRAFTVAPEGFVETRPFSEIHVCQSCEECLSSDGLLVRYDGFICTCCGDVAIPREDPNGSFAPRYICPSGCAICPDCTNQLLVPESHERGLARSFKSLAPGTCIDSDQNANKTLTKETWAYRCPECDWRSDRIKASTREGLQEMAKNGFPRGEGWVGTEEERLFAIYTELNPYKGTLKDANAEYWKSMKGGDNKSEDTQGIGIGIGIDIWTELLHVLPNRWVTGQDAEGILYTSVDRSTDKKQILKKAEILNHAHRALSEDASVRRGVAAVIPRKRQLVPLSPRLKPLRQGSCPSCSHVLLSETWIRPSDRVNPTTFVQDQLGNSAPVNFPNVELLRLIDESGGVIDRHQIAPRMKAFVVIKLTNVSKSDIIFSMAAHMTVAASIYAQRDLYRRDSLTKDPANDHAEYFDAFYRFVADPSRDRLDHCGKPDSSRTFHSQTGPIYLRHVKSGSSKVLSLDVSPKDLGDKNTLIILKSSGMIQGGGRTEQNATAPPLALDGDAVECALRVELPEILPSTKEWIMPLIFSACGISLLAMIRIVPSKHALE